MEEKGNVPEATGSHLCHLEERRCLTVDPTQRKGEPRAAETGLVSCFELDLSGPEIHTIPTPFICNSSSFLFLFQLTWDSVTFKGKNNAGWNTTSLPGLQAQQCARETDNSRDSMVS